MSNRRRSREIALQMLFQLDASEERPRETLELYRRYLSEGELPDDFSVRLFEGVADDRGHLDDVIVRASQNWRLDRMSRVDRNILRLCTYELLHDTDTPPRVAINEAVELAKRFGTEDSPSFVNGILDRIARDLKRL